MNVFVIFPIIIAIYILSTDFSKAFDSVWHPVLFHKLISAGLLPCFARLTQSFFSEFFPLRGLLRDKPRKLGALAWFIKITKIPFESVEMFRKDLFSALYFSISSSLISLLLCLLPSAALFTLTIWPFGPSPSWSLLRWRPHKELCFDWSAGLSTGVFLSIQPNVRPRSS